MDPKTTLAKIISWNTGKTQRERLLKSDDHDRTCGANLNSSKQDIHVAGFLVAVLGVLCVLVVRLNWV